MGEKINDIITKYDGKTYKQPEKLEALNKVIEIMNDFKTNYVNKYPVVLPDINTHYINNSIIYFKNKIELFKEKCGKFDKNAGKYFKYIIGLVKSLITNINHYNNIYIEEQLGGASQSNITPTLFPPPPETSLQMKKTPNDVKNILDMIYNLKIKFRDININHQYFLLNLNDNTEKSSILKRQFTYFPTGKNEAKILKNFVTTFNVNADELEKRSKTNKKWSYSVESYFKDIKYVNEIYKILVEYDSCIKFCDEINKLDPNFSFNNLKEILETNKKDIIKNIIEKKEKNSFINELIDNYNINELNDNSNINELNDNSNSNSNVITILKNIYNNHEIHSIIENVEFIVENIKKVQEPTGGTSKKRQRNENEQTNEQTKKKQKVEVDNELYNKLEYQINSDFQELEQFNLEQQEQFNLEQQEQFNLEQQYQPLPPYYNCIYARLMMNMLFIIDNTFTEEEKYSFINYINFYKTKFTDIITDFKTNNKETQINYINYIISENIDENKIIINDENTLYNFYNSIKDTYFVYDNIYGVKVFNTRHLDIIRNDNEYMINIMNDLTIDDVDYYRNIYDYNTQVYENIKNIIQTNPYNSPPNRFTNNLLYQHNKYNKILVQIPEEEQNVIEQYYNNFKEYEFGFIEERLENFKELNEKLNEILQTPPPSHTQTQPQTQTQTQPQPLPQTQPQPLPPLPPPNTAPTAAAEAERLRREAETKAAAETPQPAQSIKITPLTPQTHTHTHTQTPPPPPQTHTHTHTQTPPPPPIDAEAAAAVNTFPSSNKISSEQPQIHTPLIERNKTITSVGNIGNVNNKPLIEEQQQRLLGHANLKKRSMSNHTNNPNSKVRRVLEQNFPLILK